ncbi:MAG: methyltransferase domain-containing protein, partial [Actinomycetota bacterium]
MLALGALSKAGRDGLVIGLDPSEDALRECGRAAADQCEAVAKLALVRRNAVALPFADSTFDAVTTRSVLA